MYTMRPAEFTYERPSSLDEAVSLLGDDARPLAGGHSLLPAMKLRLATPGTLIDLSGIAELGGITMSGDALRIGAMTPHAAVAASNEVRQAVPMLAETAGLIGDRQVRRRGTIGGSVAHADPAADYPTVLVALDATISATGPDGARDIPARQFFTGLFTTALDERELVTAITVPVRGQGFGAAYEKHKSPRSGYAVVGVAATYGGGVPPALVVGGVTGAPLMVSGAAAALEGGAGPQAIEAAAGMVTAAIGDAAIGDIYASGEYRAHLASVLARRALQRAVQRAG
jgi:aerobic carbon-monoxide dehydrogenase medium subunit